MFPSNAHPHHHFLSLEAVVAGLVELHSQALHELNSGFGSEAEELLVTNLKLAIQYLKSDNGINEDHQQNTYSRHFPALLECPMEEVIVDAETKYPETCFAFYRNMFHFHDLSPNRGGTPREQLRVFVAMVYYNLGIFYHETAYSHYDFSGLTKARWHYRKAIQYVKTVPNLTPVASVLEIAAHNNMGQTYAFFGDTAGILACREGLELALRNQTHSPTILFFVQSLTLAQSYVPPLAQAA